jgi:hypothetical protein
MLLNLKSNLLQIIKVFALIVIFIIYCHLFFLIAREKFIFFAKRLIDWDSCIEKINITLKKVNLVTNSKPLFFNLVNALTNSLNQKS